MASSGASKVTRMSPGPDARFKNQTDDRAIDGLRIGDPGRVTSPIEMKQLIQRCAEAVYAIAY